MNFCMLYFELSRDKSEEAASRLRDGLGVTGRWRRDGERGQ